MAAGLQRNSKEVASCFSPDSATPSLPSRKQRRRVRSEGVRVVPKFAFDSYSLVLITLQYISSGVEKKIKRGGGRRGGSPMKAEVVEWKARPQDETR